MRIGGIAGKKHPTLKRGEVIELTPDKKIEEMAKEAIVKSSPEGLLYVPMSSKATTKIDIIRGRKDVSQPEPNQFIGTALVRYRTVKLDMDKVFPVKTQEVKIHCKDSKDHNGVTDLELISFKML